MRDGAQFIYEMYQAGFYLGVSEGQLRYKLFKKCAYKDRTLDQIKLYKNELIDALGDNSFNPKHCYDDNFIYRLKINKPKLSFSQERLLFVEKYSEGTHAYNVPFIFKLAPHIDAEVLQLAIQGIVTRHEILRTIIQEDGNSLIVLDQELFFRRTFLQDKEWKDVLFKDVNRVFDLEKEPPFYGAFYQTDTTCYLTLIFHHIAFDGWSINIFFQELEALYAHYVGQTSKLVLPTITIQYQHFATWQRYYMTGPRLQQHLQYWIQQLVDYEPLNLITSHPRPKEINYSGRDLKFSIDFETSNKLKEKAKELNVSLYSLLLSGYYLMLRAFSHQEDLLVGTPVANRHYAQIENLIGCFVNILALRAQIKVKSSVKDFIQQIHQMVIEAQNHQDLPFEKLIEALQIEKDTSRAPLVQIMFLFEENNILFTQNSLLAVDPVVDELYQVAKFDLTTYIQNHNGVLKGGINYATSLFDLNEIERFCTTYLHILKQLANLESSTPLYELSYLQASETQHILQGWNETAVDYPKTATLHGLFETHVLKRPDAIAVATDRGQLSFSALNNQANQLAYTLRTRYALSPEARVALCVKRSEHVLVGILGVLKAGGVYVPLDPETPLNRLKMVLDDIDPQLVLVDAVCQKKISELTKVPVSMLQEIASPIAFSQNLNLPVGSSSLAYIIYTSGTTGKPKGVMINHHSVVNYAHHLSTCRLIDIDSIVDYSTDIIFDLTVTTTLAALSLGARVEIFTSQIEEIDVYKTYLKERRIEVIKHVPRYFQLLANDLFQTKVKTILVGGEKFDPKILKKIHSASFTIYDEYGPTETTVGSCLSQVYPEKQENIGKPIANTRVYVLDLSLNPVPVGGVGELYISGEGVARGYWGCGDLTAKRFIANPFEQGTRMYRTGDLVRWCEDSNLEYIDRADQQVKLRGYRIELEEIENQIRLIPGVRDAAIALKKHGVTGEDYLIGYWTPSLGEDAVRNEEVLRKSLEDFLPSYMIPSVWVRVEQLPLTSSGKLDRKLLPDPDLTLEHDHDYIAPRTALEMQLSAIWKELLGIKQISVRADFFRLGGDSIASIQAISRMRQSLGIAVSIKDIFQYRTIENIAEMLEKKKKPLPVIQTEQGALTGRVKLLPIQEWFFENGFKNYNHWNQSFLIKTPKLEIDQLKTSLKKLVEHHDGFRLRYKKSRTDESYVQYYDAQASTESLKTLDIRTLKGKEGTEEFEFELQDILTGWQSYFNIERGPLYSIGYLYGYKDGSARLYFALHHLIVDTVSWRILAENLKDLYSGKALGFKGSSYRQWAETIKSYAKEHEEERDYWEAVLSDYIEEDKLKNLKINEETLSSENIALTVDQTKKLIGESNEAYHTEINDLLLTALGRALTKLTKSSVNHIILEGHGREEIDESVDITGTLGWFTTLYPVRLETFEDLGESLKNIKEILRQIPKKGIGYGSLIGYERAFPRISFNYLGQFDGGSLDEGKSQWSIVEENSGVSMHQANHDNNIININGLVINGVLQFNLSTKLDTETTTLLARLFKESLEEITHYTTHQTRTYLTVSDVNNIIDQGYLDKIQSSREIEGVYKAGSLQEGFIYHALSQGDVDDAYRVQMLFEYNHKVDAEKLKEAWESAQRKYSTLRLRFAWDEELVQIIDKKGSVDWRYIDLSDEKENTQDLYIKEIQKDDRREAYDLGRGCLFRVYIIKQKEDLYTCLFSSHHAILDGWSNPILLGYIHESYLRMVDGKIPVERRDYSYEASQKYLQEHEQDNNKYWEEYVSQIEERADLKGLLKPDQSTIKISEYKHIKETQEERVIIKDGFYDALKEVSQEEGVTLNAILQYAWHKALKVYGNSAQTVVGMTISGRGLPIDDVESSVGLYINTLPLIVDHKSERDKTIIGSIKEIQENINEINSRSGINLARLQSGGERLFDCLFVFENYPNPEKEGGERLKIRFKDGIEKLDYPLSVTTYEENKALIFNLSYAGEIFKQDKIKNLVSTAKTILKQIGENPYAEEKKLSYLNESQYEEIVERWNETDRRYPDDKTIQRLFEEQVEKTPENIALIYEGTQLTYRELNERSNQLAHYILQNHTIEPDTLIALCLDRSEHMLIGILAVLKAGAAYVPMDPSYPDSRVGYMLEDTNTKIVLTNESHRQRLEEIIRARVPQFTARDEQFEKNNEVVEVLAIDDSKVQERLLQQPLSNPETETTSHHLAYVIYTSGTTGDPKGVMQSHGNVMRLFTATEDWYHFRSSDVWTLFHSYVFDFSVWEIWGALIYGGKLIIPSYEQTRDLNLFYELCKREKVTVLNQTPSSFYQFAGVSIHRSKLTELRYIIFGGEALNLSQLKPWFDCYGCNQPKLINMYGITETTVHVTYKAIEEKDLGEQSYIGHLIPDLKAYVLDRDLNPLPIGAIGELYIGGVGLARGYLNQPELTAERFIDNPFQTEKEKIQQKNARLYKTGDLVRWCGDGNLEYIGRNDFQVKIRGYRIELGEIESALSSYEGIKQSVVLAKDHKDSEGKATENKYLVGYYVSEGPLDVGKIRVYLQTKMPDYMVPSALVHLEELPLTINGKLDRKALPDPSFTDQKTYVAPRNELERHVVEIWAEVLGLSQETLGIQDDFFRIGGNSLAAIKFISLIRSRKNIEIPLRILFVNPVLKDFCSILDSDMIEKIQLLPSIVPTPRKDLMPLSFAQQRVWFLETLLQKESLYHIPLCLRIQGFLDKAALKKTLDYMVSRHEPLRTKLITVAGVGYQKILESSCGFALTHCITNSEISTSSILQSFFSKPFCWDEEQLCRGILIEEAEEEFTLAFVFHHTIMDEGSLKIFSRELSLGYQNYLNNVDPKLPALAVQYADYSEWQRKWLSGEVWDKKLQYWTHQLDGFQTLQLPADYSRLKDPSYQGSTCSDRIASVDLEGLKALATQENVTLFTIFLSLFVGVLSKLANQNDIVFGTPFSHRKFEEIEPLLGFFVNTVVVRADTNGNPTFQELLHRVEKIVLDAVEHQDLPFEQLVEHLKIERDLGRHPIFQTMFSFEDTYDLYPQFCGAQVSPYSGPEIPLAKFDITFSVSLAPEGVSLVINYATDLFKEERIKHLLQFYQSFLKEILENPTKKLSDISIVHSTMQEISSKNSTSVIPFLYEGIHSAFQNKAKAQPDTVATICGNQQITYKLLNEYANAVSHFLISHGVGTEVLVGLCIPKSLEMVIGVLAVVKAGGAYVPLEAELPEKRLVHMLSISNVQILITSQTQRKKFESFKGDIFYIEDLLNTITLIHDPNVLIPSESLAYLIYTSGSTGNPKGVFCSHKGVNNTLYGVNQQFSVGSDDRVLALSGLGFDLSVYDIFGILGVGGQIILPDPSQQQSLDYLTNLISKHEITLWNTVPQLASLLIDHTEIHSAQDTLQTLRLFLLSGDSIPLTLPDRIKKSCAQAVVMSLGGATEGSIWSIWYEVDKLPKGLKSIPYGKAMPYQEMWVLDQYLDVCAQGTLGEIYIGGEGVVRGYATQPALTAERFIAHPFRFGKRLYKTGDLGRYLPDGNIEFMGRADSQTKIRGYRVELGEIQACILSTHQVSKCAVIVLEDDTKQKNIVAYVVPLSNDKSDDIKNLNQQCLENLPLYMQPHRIIVVQEIPLTPNGKVDYKSLPRPERNERTAKYHPPIGPFEESLAKIWEELFGIEKMSRKDNFFTLGGDSITAIQMVSKAKKAGIIFDIKQVFLTPTIEGLCSHTSNSKISLLPSQEKRKGSSPLLPLQRNFFENEDDLNHFNQSMWFIPQREIDLEVLKKILTKIRDHHDVFRLRYFKNDEGWKQFYEEDNSFSFSVIEEGLSEEEILQHCNATQKSLDILHGPLDRVVWFKGRGFLWVIHHLIVDGVSWRILLDDINTLMNGAELSPKTHSFQEWGEYINNYRHLDTALTYYSNISDMTFMAHRRSLLEPYRGQETVSFSAQETRLFLKDANQSYGTYPQEILLLAVVLALEEIQQVQKITLMLEGHGREMLESGFDLTRTVGWFTSMYPVNFTLSSPHDFSASLKEIKEQFRSVPEKGMTYGVARLQNRIKPILSDVIFNYLGQWDNAPIRQGAFNFGSYSTGESKGIKRFQEHLLEINSFIKDSILTVNFSYEAPLQNTTVKRLTESFKDKFIRLLDFCTQDENYGFTPSDFEVDQLSQEDLDTILEKMSAYEK